MKEHYKRGGLGDVVIKNILNTTLQDLLSPMRDRRESYKQENIKEMLYTGTQKARKVAVNTIEQVRSAIGINYFA